MKRKGAEHTHLGYQAHCVVDGGKARIILAVVCWSGICGLGSIEIGSLGPINPLSLDHKSGSPESQLGHLPDINKPPLQRVSVNMTHIALCSCAISMRGLPDWPE